MVNDYLLGFLSGVGATVFGFVLTMIWEVWRDRKRESKEKQKIIGNLLTEMKENLGIIVLNKELCNKNISMAKEEKQSLGALLFFHDSAWNLAKTSGILTRLEYEQLKEIEETYHFIEVINTQIESRESFKINNQALQNSLKSLADLDKTLIMFMEILNKRIPKIRSILEKINQK